MGDERDELQKAEILVGLLTREEILGEEPDLGFPQPNIPMWMRRRVSLPPSAQDG